LQLANFWQDVSRDLEKGRIYIPLDALAGHGLTEADIVNRRFDDCYVTLMKALIARTRAIFQAGMPLAKSVEPFLSVDLEMFSRGGRAILDAIEASGYNTLEHRPSLSKWTQAKLLGKTLALSAFSRGGKSQHAAAAANESDATEIAPTSSENSNDVVPRDRSVIKLRPYSDSVRESYAECNRIARAAHSSFYLAFFGLRKEKRNALCALY